MRIILAAALVMAVGTARADQVNGLIADPPGANGLVLVPSYPPQGIRDTPPICCQTQTIRPTQRAYTLDEIDRMRAAVLRIVGPTFACDTTGCLSPERIAEDRLRTYMSAGISPEELERKVGGK